MEARTTITTTATAMTKMKTTVAAAKITTTPTAANTTTTTNTAATSTTTTSTTTTKTPENPVMRKQPLEPSICSAGEPIPVKKRCYTIDKAGGEGSPSRTTSTSDTPQFSVKQCKGFQKFGKLYGRFEHFTPYWSGTLSAPSYSGFVDRMIKFVPPPTAHSHTIFHAGLDTHQHHQQTAANPSLYSTLDDAELSRVFTFPNLDEISTTACNEADEYSKRTIAKGFLEDINTRLYRFKEEKGELLRKRDRMETLMQLIQTEGYINQCYLKLAELDYLCNFELTTNMGMYIDLCSGPGGFTEYLNAKNWKTFGYSFQYFISRVKREKLLNMASVMLFTGDILEEKDRIIFSESVHRVASLITADGELDCNKRENQQEKINLPIIRAQIDVAMRCLLPGGKLVIKFFDMFLDSTKLVLYDLYNRFEQFKIIKPLMSRLLNAERYIVASGFKTPDQYTVPPISDEEILNSPRFLAFADIIDANSLRYAIKQMNTLLQFDTNHSADDPLSNFEDKFQKKLKYKIITIPQSIIFKDVLSLANIEEPPVVKPIPVKANTLAPGNVTLTTSTATLSTVNRDPLKKDASSETAYTGMQVRIPLELIVQRLSQGPSSSTQNIDGSKEEKAEDEKCMKKDGLEHRAPEEPLPNYPRDGSPWQKLVAQHIVDVGRALHKFVVPLDFCIGFLLIDNFNRASVRWAPLKHLLDVSEHKTKNGIFYQTMVQLQETRGAYLGFMFPANTVAMCTFTWMKPQILAGIQMHDLKWVYNEDLSERPFAERRKVLDEVLALYLCHPTIKEVEVLNNIYPPSTTNFEKKVEITRCTTGNFYYCTALIHVMRA